MNEQPRSYKVACKTSGDGNWAYNGLRFPTRGEAGAYGADLAGRWFALADWEVHESEDAPNTTIRDGRLERLGEDAR